MKKETTQRHMQILDYFSIFALKRSFEDYDFHYSREQLALVENYNALIS